MGTSNWQNIPFCIDVLRLIAPEHVLDVGVGFGRWGILVREFCDVWAGRVARKDWSIQIEGVEAFPNNVSEYHYSFYNKIHVGDFCDLAPQLPGPWNVVIFGDVLEHFAKSRAEGLLQWSLDSSDYTLVNVPLGSGWPQGAAYGNEYERHVSIWEADDFKPLCIRRSALFRDYIDRSFGSFVLSRQDPKGIAYQPAVSEGQEFTSAHGVVVQAQNQYRSSSECDELRGRLDAVMSELQSIRASRAYRLVERTKRTRLAPLVVRILRLMDP